MVRALLEDALEVARHEGATALSMALPTVHPYGETARRMGFVPGNLLAGLGYERRDDDVLEFLARDPAARPALHAGRHGHDLASGGLVC